MGSNNRSEAAKKSNRTRKARRLFEMRYPETAAIVRDILEGCDIEDIASYHDVSKATVVTVKGNLSRSSEYADLARDCNYKRGH